MDLPPDLPPPPHRSEQPLISHQRNSKHKKNLPLFSRRPRRHFEQSFSCCQVRQVRYQVGCSHTCVLWCIEATVVAPVVSALKEIGANDDNGTQRQLEHRQETLRWPQAANWSAPPFSFQRPSSVFVSAAGFILANF